MEEAPRDKIEVRLGENASPVAGPVRTFENRVVFEVTAGAEIEAEWPVFLRMNVLGTIIQHGSSDLKRELGGALVGRLARWETAPGKVVEAVELEYALPAQHVTHTHTNITFTHETWNTFAQQMQEHYPDYRIMGWYHTHPGFGVFLSEYDLFIHENFFNSPGQVALVFDPLSRKLGCFQTVKGKTRRVAFSIYTAAGGEARLKEILEQTGLAKASSLIRRDSLSSPASALPENTSPVARRALEESEAKLDTLVEGLGTGPHSKGDDALDETV